MLVVAHLVDYSFIERSNNFIGTGEKLTGLELFHPDRMADRILGMGDVLTLIEKASEEVDEKMMKKLAIKCFRPIQFNGFDE